MKNIILKLKYRDIYISSIYKHVKNNNVIWVNWKNDETYHPFSAYMKNLIKKDPYFNNMVNYEGREI